MRRCAAPVRISVIISLAGDSYITYHVLKSYALPPPPLAYIVPKKLIPYSVSLLIPAYMTISSSYYAQIILAPRFITYTHHTHQLCNWEQDPLLP